MSTNNTAKIILASSSPRRTLLLQEAGIPHAVHPADIQENFAGGEAPDQLVIRLAKAKADAVASQFPSRVILAADTIVYLGGEAIGKPRDLSHARQLLESLSGRTHEVYTGVCIMRFDLKRIVCWHATTGVKFNDLSDDDIQCCLDEGNPLDKAGGYAVQEHESLLIDQLTGLRSNVMGLPIEEVVERLGRFLSYIP